ncbi:MAG: TIM barrel protein, partial [archaeon]|nr:TIM barrel protein [archaeon]
MDNVIFGPAGKPIEFKGKAFLSPEFLGPLGLHAFEYQSTYGVRIGEGAALKLRESAEENNVLVSMHCPYYVNLASKESEKIDKTIEHLLKSARVGEFMGAYRLVFHPGFYSNRKPDVVLELAKETCKKLISRCEDEGIENFTFAPETTGKRSQLGNIDEIIDLCASFEHFEPTIDFAHVHARGRGILNTKEDYNCIFSKIEDNLDIERLHCHFTTIEYTYAGERKHHTLAEDDKYGPYIK